MGGTDRSLRRRKRQLKRAVKRGSLSRIRRLFSSEAFDCAFVDSQLDHRGHAALHIACKRGHHRVALWLLEHGANCHLLDPLGNSPLHLAVERFVKKEIDEGCDESESAALALHLLRANYLAFYSNNLLGRSPESLLRPYMRQLEKNHLPPSPLRSYLTAVQCFLDQIYELKAERIAQERWDAHCFEEFLDEQDAVDGGEWQFSQTYPSETYHERLDRLGEEIKKRRRQINTEGTERRRETEREKVEAQSTSQGAQQPPLAEDGQKRLRPIKSDRTLQAVEHERRFVEVLMEWNADCEKLGFDDIPWPAGKTVDAMVGVLLHGTDRTSLKGRVHELLKRWHPDKFMQKFQESLLDADRQKILGRVTELSQALTKHGADG